MHAPLPAAAAYVCTVFICCLVIFRTVALWYYKPQRLWWPLVFSIVFLFLIPGILVAVLIGCIKYRIIHPPQDTPQPIAVLLRSLLAITLAAEIQSLWGFVSKFVEKGRWVARITILLTFLLQGLDVGRFFSTSHQLLLCIPVAVESLLVHISFVTIPVFKIWQVRAGRQVRNRNSSRVTLRVGIPGIILAVASTILLAIRQTDYFLLGECIVACLIMFSSDCARVLNYISQDIETIGDGESDVSFGRDG